MEQVHLIAQFQVTLVDNYNKIPNSRFPLYIF